MSGSLPPSAQKVQESLTALGLSCRVMEMPESTRTASEAAAAVGCRVEQIVKSLVFKRALSGRPILILASGPNRVDEALMAGHIGEPLARADADEVRQFTGFAIGGVPPIGHAVPLETLIDQDLLNYPSVWAAAGTPRTVFEITPAELVQITSGRVLPIH